MIPTHRTRSTSTCGLLAGWLVCGLCPAAQAATTSWAAADGGTWEAAANWSAGVPGPLDLAVVAPPTRPVGSIVLNTATTLGGLTLARVNLQVRADLTVTGAVSWTENDPVLPGVLGFANAPTLRWQGTVALTGNGFRGLNNTGVLDLAATTTWSGNTQAGGNAITVGITSPNTVVRNRGVFNDTNRFDTTLSGRGTFDNQGNFVKSGASVTRVDIANFVNAGSVTVGAGTLLMPVLTGTQTGSWQVDAGAMLDFAGGTPTLTGTFSGSGTMRISGGTVAVEGFGHNVPMLLDGGTLTGASHVLDGPFTWRSGAFAGSGSTVLTGVVTLQGAAPLVIGEGRQITSYGTTTLSGGALIVGQGTQGLQTRFVNLGEFRDEGTGGRTLRGLDSNVSTFANAGTYVKTGSGLTIVSSLSFDNTGVLDVRAGLMRFNTPLANTGLIRVAAGAGLLNAPASASPLDNLGTLTGDGGIDNVGGGIVNRGRISPGDAIGTLTLGNVVLATEGELKIELGAAGTHDLLSLTGTVSFGGTLALWNAGYVPLAGDSLTVMSFASRVGDSVFDAVQLYGFGTGVAFDVVYGATDIRLVVVSASPLPAVPEPSSWALGLAGLAVVAARLRRRAPARDAAIV